jgi:YesN/AraC family two-component response regulator
MDKKSILVVDDEENSRNGLFKILSKYNYEVFTAETGVEALQCLEKRPCDVILTDMRMPGMSGIDLLKKVKDISPNIGVIIFTAYGEVDSYLDAMNLGAFEYLNKPVKVDELKKVIAKVFEKRKTYAMVLPTQKKQDNLNKIFRILHDIQNKLSLVRNDLEWISIKLKKESSVKQPSEIICKLERLLAESKRLKKLYKCPKHLDKHSFDHIKNGINDIREQVMLYIKVIPEAEKNRYFVEKMDRIEKAFQETMKLFR